MGMCHGGVSVAFWIYSACGTSLWLVVATMPPRAKPIKLPMKVAQVPPPMKKKKSGLYKTGARKGVSDTRMGKKVEAGLRAEVADLRKRCEDMQRRITQLEAEVAAERALRMTYEGEAATVVPRYRAALRDLRAAR